VPDNPRDDLSLAQVLKFAIDALKAFYREAASAQPGSNSGRQINDWFYGETAAGKALYALRPLLNELAEQREDNYMKLFANRLLIPHQQAHRAS
ncbi:MAG: hypothetical protein QF491_09620, partial [Alphaproteobacteria bacterium]|nr:hypothetical protein [Alphaproteobacteria bacterium]